MGSENRSTNTAPPPPPPLLPPGLGSDAELWLPMVMVPHANGTALRRLALAEHEGGLQEPLALSIQFTAGGAGAADDE